MKSEIEVPDGWEVKRLDEITTIIISNVDKKRYENEMSVSLCNYKDVYDNHYINSKLNFMNGTAKKVEIEKFTLLKNDVIITKDSETKIDIASSSVVIEELKNVICGYHLAILRPMPSLLNGIFLMNVLKIKPVNNHFVKYAQGLTRFGLTVDAINRAKIPLPPFEEQQKIADILSKVYEQIDFTEKIIDKTEELKKGLMQKLFTKGIGPAKFKKTELGRIPEGWGIVKFNKKLDIISGKGFKYAEYSEGGVKLLKIDNVSYNEITWDSVYYLPTDYIEKYPNLCLEENDILLALNRPITNDKLKIGMLERKDLPAILYQRVGKIIIKNDINRKFIYYLLSHILLPFIKQNNVGGNIPFINLSQLRNLKIILPPINEQKQIASILSKVDEQIQDNKKELKHLKELKKGLMQDLLTGKVRVSV